MNGSELCKLLRGQPLKKGAGWKMAQVKTVKQSHSEERKEPYREKSVILSSKSSKSTKEAR